MIVRLGRKWPEKRLVQLTLEICDAFGKQVVGNLVLDGAGEDRFGRGDRDLGGRRAHVGERLSFGLSDFAFRHLGAPHDELFDLGLGLDGEPLGLCLGAGDDRLRFMLGFLLLASVCGKQGFRFRLEPACLVELRFDAFPPVVDTLEQALVRPEITEHADEDDKGDRDPELGFKHWLPQRLSARLMASATSSPPGAMPVSRSTIAPAASLAMLRTFPIAADRVPAIVFSASAIRAWSFASTSLRRASAAAAAFARVSLARVCARPRASANAFSWAAMAASDSSLKRCASARSSSTRWRRASRIEPIRGSPIRDINR